MVPPRILCRKHLLGEHVELHMASAWILKGKRIDGWAESNCLEPRAIGKRHEALVREMTKRGYSHHSSLVQPMIGAHQFPYTKVDRKAALAELVQRCPDCASLVENSLKINVSKAQNHGILLLADLKEPPKMKTAKKTSTVEVVKPTTIVAVSAKAVSAKAVSAKKPIAKKTSLFVLAPKTKVEDLGTGQRAAIAKVLKKTAGATRATLIAALPDISPNIISWYLTKMAAAKLVRKMPQAA